MNITVSKRVAFYALPSAVKEFQLGFFVLLPVFYAGKLIKAQEMGLIGALAIAMVIVGAIAVAHWLHEISTRRLLLIGGATAVLSSALLLEGIIGGNLGLVVCAYGFLGLTSGLAMSGSNAAAAEFTQQGDRFGQLAKQSIWLTLSELRLLWR